jgi:hypothetical protein
MTMAKKSASILDQICTAEEAGAILNLTPERVMTFCREGRIEARKMGRDWVLSLASVREFAELERSGGRPKNSEK